MQGGRRGRDGFQDFDPFAGFSGFGGLGGHQSLVSSFFGGRDPFDDPFFTRPFGSPFGSMFEPSLFGSNGSPFSSSPFSSAPPTGFIEHQEPQPNKRRGPVIQELNSDDENEEDGGARDNPRKHFKSDQKPYVEIPDDEADDGRNKHIQNRRELHSRMQPQSQCFTFQSSTVSYGGPNGTYYTKALSKRAGSDGVTFEEFKEADSTTGQANHRVSRGLHNKGHTLARKLNSDGKVDTMQTLHNLNEDELTGFEQAWEGSAARLLPGWKQRLEGVNNNGNMESSSSHGQASRGGWALPSTQRPDQHPHMPSQNAPAFMQQQTGQRAANRDSRSRGKMRS